MKVHGDVVPFSGHFSPLGQQTSPGSISLIDFLVQVKQNLCEKTEGHCTKSDPSRSPRQFMQLISAAAGDVAVESSGFGVLGSVLTASVGATAASVLAIVSAEVRVVAVVRAEVWTGTDGRVLAAVEEVGEKAESVLRFARFSWE